jgi:hypothetical protein
MQTGDWSVFLSNKTPRGKQRGINTTAQGKFRRKLRGTHP